MNTLKTTDMFARFATAIRQTVPTLRPYETWHHTPDARQTELAGAATRNFYLTIRDAKPTYGLTGGEGSEYTARVGIATSYKNLPVADLEHIILEDACDLRRELSKLRSPTLDGLYDVIPQPFANARIDELENIVLEHMFLVRWHQATY